MKKGVIIFDFNRTLFDPEKNELFSDTRLILKYFLDHSFNLVLIGKGDKNRRKKVKDLDIEKYFSTIHIVEEKLLSQLEEIAYENSDKEIYSVGDRVKKEILLGNKSGFTTIWLKNGKYSIETPDSEKEIPDYTIERLYELKQIIN